MATKQLKVIREAHRVASAMLRRSFHATRKPPTATGPVAQHLFDCRNRTSLPGRSATDSADPFKTIEHTTGQVAGFYQEFLKRNSVDNHGEELTSSAHYGRHYQNAFWNGQQMVYGDGDGQIFVEFWKSPDVIGHELTHGVTQHESALQYEGEPGALNESISDCFGAVFNQWINRWPASEPRVG